MTAYISDAQRAEAKDMGWEICENCGTSFIPAPGYENDGHQCGKSDLGD